MAQLSGDGADAVAYQALMGIATHEQKEVAAGGLVVADKKWILDTLAEIYATMNPLNRKTS
jgi:hypothetical protein